jgi:hypothetical protein
LFFKSVRLQIGYRGLRKMEGGKRMMMRRRFISMLNISLIGMSRTPFEGSPVPGFDLICVYWFSYRNRYKPVRVYISGVAP